MSGKISVYYWDDNAAKLALHGEEPNMSTFLTNYRKVVEIPVNALNACKKSNDEESCAEEVFNLMQGENWSRHGEARELIKQKGLSHTSMSVGDILEIEGKFYITEGAGFKKIW